MFTRIIAATALTLALGGASFAQTSATQGVNPVAEPDTSITSSTNASTWSPAMNSAFYNDDGVTLRSQAEVQANWSNLSSEEKEMVKADCAKMVNDGSTENTGRSDLAGLTGTRTDQAAISQVCAWTRIL